MTANRKCIEVETGALVFAILNVMITSLGTVLSLGGLVYSYFITEIAIEKADMERDEKMMVQTIAVSAMSSVVLGVVAVGFCISFAFAIVLIVGLCKRKAALVKCYFVYGVMKVVFGVVAVFGMVISTYMYSVVLLMCIIQIINVLILMMIRSTYKKFEAEVPFNSFANPLSTVEKY